MLHKALMKICNEWLLSADKSMHELHRIYQLARIGAEEEFNLDITGGFRTELLDVNPNKTVQFPTWAQSFSKIGIINQAGEIVTLKVNNQLSNYHAIYYDQMNRYEGVPLLNTFDLNSDIPTGYPYFYPNWYLNYFGQSTSYNLFGMPSGTPSIGSYKIDIKNNVILLNPEFPYSKVLFEGLDSGIPEANSDYMIPIQAANAMRQYIRWKNMEDLPKKYSMSQVERERKKFYNEKRLAAMRINPLNITEVTDAERQSWKLVAKA